MLTEYVLSRLRAEGKPAKRSREITARGHLTVAEHPCPVHRRQVLMATFDRTDGGEPIPPLRDAVLRAARPTGIQTISGVEELASGPLADPQQCAQTWRLLPVEYAELERIELHQGRLVNRLSQLGVQVTMLPDGRMVIDGETYPD